MAFADKKAILIDWDGTVVDSMPYKSRQFAETLRRYANIDDQEFGIARRLYLDMAGKPLEDQFRRAARRLRLRVNLSELIRAFNQSVMERPPGLFEHARETLSVLANEDRMLIIVSSAPRKEIEMIVKAQGLQDAVARVASKDHVAQIIENLRRNKGILPRDILLIGDSRYDMKIAKQFGLTAVGFGRTQRHAGLREAGGYVLVSDWPRLLKMFQTKRSGPREKLRTSSSK